MSRHHSLAVYNEYVTQLYGAAPQPIAKPAPVAPSALDVRSVPSGHYLVGAIELKVDNLANDDGQWRGWVFVKRNHRERIGSQKPGFMYRGAHEHELRVIVANPLEAAVAFGRQTGRCAICSRLLSDPDSIARGIGPICAQRFDVEGR